MGQYDFSCNTSMDLLSYDGLYDNVRIYCYWKCNGWRYSINHVYGWVTCDGTERIVYDDGDGEFQNSQGEYCLGYSDYSIRRGHSDKTWSYSARLKSESTYISGERWSDSGWYTTGAVKHTVITYNANSGSGAPGNQDKWYGESLYLSSTTPTRTGYTFQKWNTASNGSGTSYNPGQQYTPDPGGTVTLYAIWKANTYTVSYNANGGSGAPGNQTKTYGQTLTLSTGKPIRSGYNFSGWATSSSGSVAYQPGGSYTNNSAVTLYAIWTVAYQLPRITNLNIFRCNSSGTASDSGTYLKFACSWATDNNVTKVRCEWRKQTVSSWSGSDISSSGKSGTVSSILGSNSITNEDSWYARIYVTDSGGTTYSSTVSIGTVVYPMDIKAGGKGIAFGKVAETDDMLESNFKVKFNKAFTVKGERIERKLAIVGRSNNAGSNFWYKFASIYLNNKQYEDRSIVFMVHAGYNDTTDQSGMLIAHVRTNGNCKIEECQLEWEYCGRLINPSYFKIAYQPNANPCNVELWWYCDAAYKQCHFDVMSEFSRTSGNFFDDWVVYKTVTESGAAAPTSGYTLKDSLIKLGMVGGYVLYDNSSGTDGTVTLSATSSLFSYLEIYYMDNNSKQHKCIKVKNPDSKVITIDTVEPWTQSTSTYMRASRYTISGTSITKNEGTYVILEKDQVVHVDNNHYHKIVQVIGYRR